jgi:protein SCO1/2
MMDDLMWNHGPIGGPFKLVDQDGRQTTDADFRGKLLLVYFGYTSCPDVCPADLREILFAVDRLGAGGQKVQPLFISIDPERDTKEVLAKYVHSFDPRLVGLTGSPDEIRTVSLEYKAYFAKYVPPSGESYVIEHAGVTYLMGADGNYLGFFPPGTSAERMDEIIRPYLPQ